ncbi:MAG: ATP-dependent DNA ligase [Myxococcota bacterium]|jgi:ATP-dependent DNA ligase
MLPFAPPLEPMLANAEEEIPEGDGWVYEPKWDGFRCVVFRDGQSVHLSSRNGQPLQRYFPEVVAALARALPERCVVDGEIILPGERGLDFDALQARIHPAASRVERLSKKTPAGFVAFDLLALGDDDWREKPGSDRREALVRAVTQDTQVFVTPQTPDVAVARGWFHDFEGAGCDGVIARRVELPYQPGKRVMVKVKHHRTADCVVGAYREGKTPGTVGSLLLGLYGDDGVLHHVGHTSSFSAKEKQALKVRLAPYEGGESFGRGRTPDAPSRWSKKKDAEGPSWVPLTPSLVCEVRYDSLQGPRFRHAATFLRWRTDKAPSDCTFQQLLPPRPFSLERVVALARGG